MVQWCVEESVLFSVFKTDKSAKQTDHIKSEESDYIPSDSSPASEEETNSQAAELTPPSRELSSTENEITYDASDRDESD